MNRRNFLKLIAASAVAVAVPLPAVAAGAPAISLTEAQCMWLGKEAVYGEVFFKGVPIIYTTFLGDDMPELLFYKGQPFTIEEAIAAHKRIVKEQDG